MLNIVIILKLSVFYFVKNILCNPLSFYNEIYYDNKIIKHNNNISLLYLLFLYLLFFLIVLI